MDGWKQLAIVYNDHNVSYGMHSCVGVGVCLSLLSSLCVMSITDVLSFCTLIYISYF
jgi:hypothetical protein